MLCVKVPGSSGFFDFDDLEEKEASLAEEPQGSQVEDMEDFRGPKTRRD